MSLVPTVLYQTVDLMRKLIRNVDTVRSATTSVVGFCTRSITTSDRERPNPTVEGVKRDPNPPVQPKVAQRRHTKASVSAPRAL